MIRKYLQFAFIIVTLSTCRKPYNPPAIVSPGTYLVVDGVINSGPDSTIIKLSKTVNVTSDSTTNPVLHAMVTVESDDNKSYPLTERTNGKYVIPGLNLDTTRQYRLHINTADGKKYVSDFEAVINTPPIDSVGYNVQANGLQLYVNAHDPTNRTKYYRWDYQETWKFHSAYDSEWVSNGDDIVPRTKAQNIYYCFGNQVSSTILLGATTKLSKNIIYQSPLTAIASTSEKLEIKYSILVRQYALSGDAYTFWTNLKKNTEELGGIFDAEPSTINGNIHNTTDPSERIFGYISVCRVQQKRIFIDNGQLPQTWNPVSPYYCSGLDTVKYCGISGNDKCFNFVATQLIPKGSTEIPVHSIDFGTGIIGFLSAGIECVDCTLRGVTKQPDFWK